MARNVQESSPISLTFESLTCRSFRGQLSRPFIFASFHFYPYYIHDDAVLLPSPEEVERRLQRLDFWFSDEIAPLVREDHFFTRERYDVDKLKNKDDLTVDGRFGDALRIGFKVQLLRFQ